MKSTPAKESYKIMEIDPWLKPYEQDINLRMDRYSASKRALLGTFNNFEAFANGHLYFGFHKTPDGWFYREWAPKAEALYLIGDFNNWNPESHPLYKKENGIWEIFLQGADTLKHGSHVKVRVKAKGIFRDRIPLYIKRTVQDPDTLDFSGQIWAPDKPYEWTDGDFQVQKNDPLLIYEAHVGMAQEKLGIGTFEEFKNNILPRIKSSGYNAVQLMAIMQHPYYASFGYHVSNFFAVSSWFGTPEELKDLVNTAHSMGLVVLMDIVQSHAVKNLSEGINEFDGTEEQFFHEGQRGSHSAWDSKVFNYGRHEVIHFLLSNIKFWMKEYHFDGFRFDGITSMIYLNHGLGINFDDYKKYFSINTDIEAINYLQFANELIREIRPDAVTIAEDMSGMPGMCLPIEYGGIGFDYRLNMGIPDFWIKTLRTYTDENWNLGGLWYEMTTKRPVEKSIGYVESHDQALVGDKTLFFRLADKEAYWHMSKKSNNHVIDRAIDLHKLIRFITLTLGGEGYLNFMGNEFGHPEWIDFPREGNNWSYHYCRRQWSLADNHDLRYEFLYNFDKEMLAFVKNYKILNEGTAENIWTDEACKVIAYRKNGLVFLYNFNPIRSYPDFELPISGSCSYKVIFNSDEESFGGKSRIDKDVIYKANTLPLREGRSGIIIYSPSRTVLVLKIV